MIAHHELVDWHPEDWDDLRAIWNDLVAMSQSDEETPHGSFRGHAINSRQAGYVFQTWTIKALQLSGIEVEPPFEVKIPGGSQTREEIDGLAFLDFGTFLIESKFQRVDFDPIGRLHLLAEQRPPGTMGLLFAARGFTLPALDSAKYLRPLRVMLFGPDEIDKAVRASDFRDAVRVKWREAVKHGVASISINQQ